jgi:hypothetical protein
MGTVQISDRCRARSACSRYAASVTAACLRLGAFIAIASFLLAATSTSVASAQPRERVLARHYLTVAGGGDVDARDGWNLYVPPHTVKHNGYGSITALGGGRIALTVEVPWRGRVQVTAPLRSAREVVAHDVGGVWFPEGTSVGESTVWVTHLSWFSLSGILKGAEGVLAGIQDALCLTALDDPVSFVECAVEKLVKAGVQYLDQQAAQYLVSKISKSCLAALTTSAIYVRSPRKIPISALLSVLGDKDCKGSASSPGATTSPSGGSAPAIPVSSTPINNSGVQGPTVNPQGSTSSPQPTPNPAPIQEPPVNNPNPAPPAGTTKGFFVEDDIYGGTWARTDPDNGTWYPHSTPPPNGAYWYPNNLGVAVDCSESAAAYAVVVNGVHSSWSWWAHVTDGKWVPTVVFSAVWSDGQLPGLPVC